MEGGRKAERKGGMQGSLLSFSDEVILSPNTRLPTVICVTIHWAVPRSTDVPSSNATSLFPFTQPVILWMQRAWNLVIVVLHRSLTRHFHTVLKTFSYLDAFRERGVWYKVCIECVDKRGLYHHDENALGDLSENQHIHMLNLPKPLCHVLNLII